MKGGLVGEFRLGARVGFYLILLAMCGHFH